MILFSDRRKGAELYVLERLQRQVKNCNTSSTFLRIFLFVWSSVCLHVPANIFPEFSWSPVACCCICECPLIFRLSWETLSQNCYVSLFFSLIYHYFSLKICPNEIIFSIKIIFASYNPSIYDNFCLKIWNIPNQSLNLCLTRKYCK